ncbi:MAG: HAD family hydrolase [Candidatus Woesearchaeota archaeon]
MKALIFDVYGTILSSDSNCSVSRPGFLEIQAHFSDLPFIAFSDAPENVVCLDLETSHILKYFSKVYSERNCPYTWSEPIRTKSVPLPKNGYYKNLGTVLEDFCLNPKDCVFIGDNHQGVDAFSASFFNIPFIHVPQFRLKPSDSLVSGVYYDPDFDFYKGIIEKVMLTNE